MDAVGLTQALLRCRSVTPEDGGAQAMVAGWLTRLGFAVTHLRFGAVDNLFASIGDGAPHLCFAGHTDVVPPGDGWAHDPFAAEIDGGHIYGRGACDMKGAGPRPSWRRPPAISARAAGSRAAPSAC